MNAKKSLIWVAAGLMILGWSAAASASQAGTEVLLSRPAPASATAAVVSEREAKPSPAPALSIKMRIFEGLREGAGEPVKIVTASYLSHTLSASIAEEADRAAQEAKIRQIFNLKGVSLLTETDLVWEKGKDDKGFHFFRLGDKDYLVFLTPLDARKPSFRLEVFEQNQGRKTNLLDTEFSIAPKATAIFGFSDASGKPYFLSLQTTSRLPDAEEIPATGPVRAIGRIRPPMLIKEVQPEYPEAAKKAGVEGVVIVEAETDIYGRVQNTRILRSIPALDQAALEAVKQWVYEPAIINGKPRGVVFTVTVRFSLKEREGVTGGVVGGVVGGVMGGVVGGVIKPASPALSKEEAEKLQKMPAIRAVDKIEPPVLIKEVKTAYPEDARQARVQGVVILEVETDVYGRVASTHILRSIPMLDEAAVNAVRQWVYEPFIHEGKPRRCVFTVTVNFSLH